MTDERNEIVNFLDAWAEDQKVIANGNHPASRDWFLARSEALADAAREIKAFADKEGRRSFLTLCAPGRPEEREG